MPSDNPIHPQPSDEVEVRHPDGRIEHPLVSHESTDVNFGAVVGILAAALVLGAMIFGAVAGFFSQYREHEKAVKASPYPLAPAPSTALPAPPRLEQLDRLRGTEKTPASDATFLSSYGPTTEPGIIHIPIDRAMKLTAPELPTRPAAKPKESHDRGLVDSGASNSGRMFRRPPR